ncbi:TPA: SapB/AmfS family lantipeptide [Streptococcus pneumoniae]
MAEEVLNLQLVSVQVDETDEVDGMRFSTFSTNKCPIGISILIEISLYR